MRFALPLLIALAGCAQFPELDSAITPEMASAPIPDLMPLAPLLAQTSATTGTPPATDTALAPRLTTLQARAARLRGPVISALERDRMLSGIR